MGGELRKGLKKKNKKDLEGMEKNPTFAVPRKRGKKISRELKSRPHIAAKGARPAANKTRRLRAGLKACRKYSRTATGRRKSSLDSDNKMKRIG